MKQYVIFSKFIFVNISVKMIGMKSVKLVKKKNVFVQILINLALSVYRNFIRSNFFSEKLNYSIDSVHSINYGSPS